jgi:PHD/YefM family antitoxin component YafN of YafNO toxin-antitoxin module
MVFKDLREEVNRTHRPIIISDDKDERLMVLSVSGTDV